MTKISLKVTNTDAVMQAIRQYGQKAEVELSKAVNATALTINGEIKKMIQSPPKTGTIYNSRGKRHQASAPGEAPATDTGTLVSSITYKQESPLVATVSSRLPYAYYLEFGTKKGGKTHIEPRPAWVPATEKNRDLFNKLVDAALRRAAQ